MLNDIFFEDFSDDNTLIRGCIDPKTKIGIAEVFVKTQNIHIDIPYNGVLSKPLSDKQYAHYFARNAIRKCEEEKSKK